MKTIKLEHELAELVRQGSKTATWRIYDDKNLSVNDEIELIDKVDPQRPETWSAFAHGVIDTIIEKRLGDIIESDFDGHERFASKQAMIETYQKYYGPQVNEQTPVKMIHFSVLSENNTLTQHSVMSATGDCEGTPVSILEAGATGLPVVSTRHAGIPDVVIEGETGLLVDEHDDTSMAQHMIRLAQEPELAGRMGKAAREHIQKNFSKELRIGNLWSIINSCIELRTRLVPAER